MLKKVMALVCAAVMIIGATVPAFAVDSPAEVTSKDEKAVAEATAKFSNEELGEAVKNAENYNEFLKELEELGIDTSKLPDKGKYEFIEGGFIGAVDKTNVEIMLDSMKGNASKNYSVIVVNPDGRVGAAKLTYDEVKKLYTGELPFVGVIAVVEEVEKTE